MATQLSLFAFYMAPLVLAWLSLALELGPLSELAGHHRSVLLLLAPLVLVVLLGLYALLSVLYGVATFNDCAQARNELINEINEAKQDLAQRGIISQEKLEDEMDVGDPKKE